MFQCYSYTIITEHINLCLLKLHLSKQSTKTHRCVVNMVEVWLHILGPYWCMYVALSGSRLRGNCNTETCRSCFNVNFNTVFFSKDKSLVYQLVIK